MPTGGEGGEAGDSNTGDAGDCSGDGGDDGIAGMVKDKECCNSDGAELLVLKSPGANQEPKDKFGESCICESCW